YSMKGGEKRMEKRECSIRIKFVTLFCFMVMIIFLVSVILLSTYASPENQKGKLLEPEQLGLSVEITANKYHVKVGEIFSLVGTISNLTNQSRIISITVYSTDYGGSKVISMVPPRLGNVWLPPFGKIPFNATLEAQRAGNYTFGIVIFTPEGPAGSELLVIEVEEDLFYLLRPKLPFIVLIFILTLVFAFKPTREKLKDVFVLARNEFNQDISSLNRRETFGHISVFLVLFSIVFFPYLIGLFIYVLLFFFPSLPKILPIPSFAFILFLVGYRLVMMFGLPLILIFYGMKYKKPFLCSTVSLLPFLLFIIFYIVIGGNIFIVLQSSLLLMLTVALTVSGASLENKETGILILLVSLLLWLYQIYSQLSYLFSLE
ncbi:MAG: hypothetical protein ACPLZG_13120, partial [Thermoproteota archaeon]